MESTLPFIARETEIVLLKKKNNGVFLFEEDVTDALPKNIHTGPSEGDFAEFFKIHSQFESLIGQWRRLEPPVTKMSKLEHFSWSKKV